MISFFSFALSIGCVAAGRTGAARGAEGTAAMGAGAAAAAAGAGAGIARGGATAGGMYGAGAAAGAGRIADAGRGAAWLLAEAKMLLSAAEAPSGAGIICAGAPGYSKCFTRVMRSC